MLAREVMVTTIDPAALLVALGAFVTTTCSAIAGLVVTIRNGKRGKAVEAKVDKVHDCLHQQAADVKAVIVNQGTLAGDGVELLQGSTAPEHADPPNALEAPAVGG